MAFRRLGNELRSISVLCKSELPKIHAGSYRCQQIVNHQSRPDDLITRTYSTAQELSFPRPGNYGDPFIHKPHQVMFIQKRFKRKKPTRATADEEEEEEVDDDDDISGENPLLVDDLLGVRDDGSTQKEAMVHSLRLDTVAKVAFSLTRQKAEESFYRGELYVNGEKAIKKSQELRENDEIEITRGVNEEDSKLVNILRAQIVYVADKASESGRLRIKLKIWSDLTMPNPALKQADGADE